MNKKIEYPAENTGLDQPTKNKIIGVVKAVIPDAKIYLFGSRARGTHHSTSDIDIAVDVGETLPRASVGEINDMLNASNIMFKIDVVDLNNIPDQMKALILKEGLLWKE